MRKLFFFFAVTVFPTVIYAQESSKYDFYIAKADSFYQVKQYSLSAEAYTPAFAVNGGIGTVNDKYNAACTWSLAGNKDSAFFMLNRIATKGNYTDYNHLIVDADLNVLHSDKRWNAVCDLVKENKRKAEANLNKPLVAILDTIFQNDQSGRMQIDEVQKRYGYDSKEVRQLWDNINYTDSIDLIKVERILDKYGWLGADVVGWQGNQTIFLVIQHSDLKVQEKYLPLMRKAVKNKKANAADLALLEDRVALRQGKMQVYGSQIKGFDGSYWISPLLDPDNVDKRRAEVGLQPLAEYVKHWNIKWDVAEYKKQLPEIIKKEKQ